MNKKRVLTQAVLVSTLFVVPQVFSQTTISTVTNAPLATSTAGNIEITASGAVQVGTPTIADAITVDSASSTVQVDPNNTTSGAIVTSGTAANGINITTGTSAIITIGANSLVNTIENGILVGAATASITNSGTIQSTQSAINIAAGGTTATISNQAGATLTGTPTTTEPTVLINGTGSVITNAGTITSSTNPTVEINQPATITNASGAVISETGATLQDAILVGATANITNAGTISGKSAAGINIQAAGTSTAIVNQTGGIISGSGSHAGIYDAGAGLTLTNAGTIQGGGGVDAIQLLATFSTLTNQSGGVIDGGTGGGNGININGNISGDIENAGIITASANVESGLVVNGIFTGPINNNAGGIIQYTGTNGNAVKLTSSFTSLNNAGVIQTTNAANINSTVIVTANISGTITNSGTISNAATTPAINLQGNVTGITNSGTISGTNSAQGVIFAQNSVVASGLTNSGNITNSNAAGNAINFSNAATNIPLFQTGGTITGNVLLSGAAGTTSLTMSGGTITGGVTSGAAGTSTLNFNGGTVTGTVSVAGANNIVNLAGSTLNTITSTGAGPNTYNATGGSFNTLNGLATDILNVNGSFTAGTITKIGAINVNNTGTVFNANGPIGSYASIGVNAGATMNANANITGGVASSLSINAGGTLQINSGSTVQTGIAVNGGSLIIQPNAHLNALTSYLQSGTFAPQIQNAGSFGFITTAGNATFNAGSILAPGLATAGEFIANGTQYAVVQSTGGVVGLPALQQPTSVLVSFSESVTGPSAVCPAAHCLVLTANVAPLTSVAPPDIPLAVATSLGPLLAGGTTSPGLLSLFGQLELLPDITTLANALFQLAPPFNYALPTSSRITMDNTFDSLQMRLEDLRGVGPITQEENYLLQRDAGLYNGVNFGDIGEIYGRRGHFGAWVKAYGSLYDQHKRHEIEGFQADATGIAIGGDWSLTQDVAVGLAESYTKVNTKDHTQQQNTVNDYSYQTTLYGWIQPYDSIYVDTMVGIASHQYQTMRNIVIGNFAATANAKFYSFHWGAQLDTGYVFLNSDDWYVAPFARFRYTYLNIDSYSEYNADGVGLTVSNNALSETVAGLGLRLALKRDYYSAIYVPEISAMVLYDFSGQVMQSQATFLGGGDPFYTNSIKPAQFIQLYGFSVNAHTSDNYTFTIKFNFEKRNEFFGYNGYMQLRYQWD